MHDYFRSNHAILPEEDGYRRVQAILEEGESLSFRLSCNGGPYLLSCATYACGSLPESCSVDTSWSGQSV
jgi:hypothetical protein